MIGRATTPGFFETTPAAHNPSGSDLEHMQRQKIAATAPNRFDDPGNGTIMTPQQRALAYHYANPALGGGEWNSGRGYSSIQNPRDTMRLRIQQQYGGGGGGGGGGFSGSGGGFSGGGGGGGGNNQLLSELLAMQRSENTQTQQQNIATRNATLEELGGVATAFRGDPLWQATRASAQAMLANPEAINDETQQKIINRGSNLINAASNTARGQSRQQLAGMGLLGSSAEQGIMGQAERDRMAQLGDMTTNLEIERAMRRNQDILQAQQMGAALAGQESGVNQFVAGTRANTDLYFQPENLSGYAAYFAGGGGGGGFANGGNFGFMSGTPGASGIRASDSAPTGIMRYGGQYSGPSNPFYRGTRGTRTPDDPTGGMAYWVPGAPNIWQRDDGVFTNQVYPGF